MDRRTFMSTVYTGYRAPHSALPTPIDLMIRKRGVPGAGMIQIKFRLHLRTTLIISGGFFVPPTIPINSNVELSRIEKWISAFEFKVLTKLKYLFTSGKPHNCEPF